MSLAPTNKVWTLVDLDRRDVIVGQFEPQNVTRNISMNTAHGGSLGAEDPFTQWLRGELKTTTFTARLFAVDNTAGSNVESMIERLEDLVKRADDLKRPPICDFFVGSIESLTQTCLVKSLGGITYDSAFGDGTNRGATLQITLEKYTEITFKATDPTKPQTFTRQRLARQGDTYEAIALWEYGQPELGVVLRQLNPRLPGMPFADLDKGNPVHIYPEDYLLEQPLEPEWHGFKEDVGAEAATEALRELFAARSGSRWFTNFSDTSPKVR